MARPVLIIDMGRQSVRASGLTPGKEEAEVSFEASLGDDLKSALLEVLGRLKSSGFASFSRVYLCLPPESLTMRKVGLPIKETKKIEEVLPFELEDTLVRDTSEFVFGAVPLADGSTLAVGVEKSLLGEYIAMLRDLGVEPSWVGSSLFARGGLLGGIKSAEETAALIDRDSIVISNGRGPLLYKAVRTADDVKIALAAMEEEGIEVRSFYCAGGRASEVLPEGLDASEARGLDERFTGLQAMKLQIRGGGIAEAPNFRKGEFADTSVIERGKKGLKITMVLAVAIAVLWGGFVYVRSSSLKERAAAMKGEIMASYKRAFPRDKTVRAPLYSLEVKMKEQTGDMALLGMGVDVLGVMKRLAGPAASAGVSLYEISMSSTRVSAKGRAASFENAVKFKDGLLKLKDAGEVALGDVKTSVSGGVTFSVSMGIGEGPNGPLGQ